MYASHDRTQSCMQALQTLLLTRVPESYATRPWRLEAHVGNSPRLSGMDDRELVALTQAEEDRWVPPQTLERALECSNEDTLHESLNRERLGLRNAALDDAKTSLRMPAPLASSLDPFAREGGLFSDVGPFLSFLDTRAETHTCEIHASVASVPR